MPYLKLDLNSWDAKVRGFVWQATETEAELLDILAWSAAEVEAKRRIYTHPNTWRQHLASRALLQIMAAQTNQPLGADGWHWSLSHSGDYSVAVASRQKIGVDVQLVAPKIARLATRFMSAEEYAQFEACKESDKNKFAALVWSAKEAMFKAWRQQNVTFKTDLLLLAPLLPIDNPQIVAARAQNERASNDYSIYFNFLFGNYSLALALEER